MDQNILVKIGSFIADVNFLDYMKSFPFLIKSCNHFGIIYNLNVNSNKKVDAYLSIQNPNDISLYERIVHIVKKTIRCRKMVILNDIRYFTFSFIDVDHLSILKDIKKLKENRSIKCRNPRVLLWFSDYGLVSTNFYDRVNSASSILKIVLLRIGDNIIPISKSDLYIHNDYLKIKL